MVAGFAATYGYDVDDPADVDALFDHLFHLPFMREMAHAEGRAREVTVSPYEMSIRTARDLADAGVAEFKKVHGIAEPAQQRLHTTAAAPVQASGLLDKVKADM